MQAHKTWNAASLIVSNAGGCVPGYILYLIIYVLITTYQYIIFIYVIYLCYIICYIIYVYI